MEARECGGQCAGNRRQRRSSNCSTDRSLLLDRPSALLLLAKKSWECAAQIQHQLLSSCFSTQTASTGWCAQQSLTRLLIYDQVTQCLLGQKLQLARPESEFANGNCEILERRGSLENGGRVKKEKLHL